VSRRVPRQSQFPATTVRSLRDHAASAPPRSLMFDARPVRGMRVRLVTVRRAPLRGSPSRAQVPASPVFHWRLERAWRLQEVRNG
jgi:hypothetical protein